MNQLLPYELELNQQWLDLPLPDENMAWADMKRRLDEEGKKRIIPFWLTGCAGWALLGIVLLGLGWWIVRPERWFNSKPKTEKINPVIEKTNSTGSESSFTQTDTASTKAFTTNDSLQNIQRADSVNTNPVVDPKQNVPGNSFGEKKKTITGGNEVQIDIKQNTPSKNKRPVVNSDKKPSAKSKPVKTNDPPVVKEDPVKPNEDTATQMPTPVTIKDKPTELIPSVTVIDSAGKKTTKDSVVKKPEADPVAQDKNPKKDSSKKNPMVFSAGLGLHQQLPVAGQEWSPYSSSGRKTSLADYVPSVYLRATKPGKWFLQSEFRYGAPQHTKEFSFRQDVKIDTIPGGTTFTTTTTTSTLRKTFYHQLPLSFNYYVLPNWSIGAGMQWNNFYSAIAEKEIIQHNHFTQLDTLLGKFIEPLKRDSASEFKRSYWMGTVQTQYQWKRFTFGARYSFGLQPYINFTLPGGTPQEEKNNSFQVYILFELWKSRKNKE